MSEVDSTYPPEAYAPNRTLWWELTTWPGSKQRFGQTARLASWLWFNKVDSDLFTMNELRNALGPGIVGKSEHLNRRLRELRQKGWMIPSKKDDASLRNDEYRLEKRGARYWLQDERRSHRAFRPSARARRLVIERDHGRCVVCGVAAGESYPGEPESRARLTIGHRVPQERLHARKEDDALENWRTECAQCNETVRDELPDPYRYDEVLAKARRLGARDKSTLQSWLVRGERMRSDLDRVYDLARIMTDNEKAKLCTYLDRAGRQSLR